MTHGPPWPALLWLRRHRVLGRSAFAWRVVIRFAVPVAGFATILRAAAEPFSWGHFGAHVLANLAAAIVGGYVAGRLLWDLVVAPR